MAIWITDRSQDDVDRLKFIYSKAVNGTWTDEEKAEWLSGMKGALDYRDFSRIETGISELASLLGADVDVKTDWNINGYLTTRMLLGGCRISNLFVLKTQETPKLRRHLRLWIGSDSRQ